jgi:hypothetical protein
MTHMGRGWERGWSLLVCALLVASGGSFVAAVSLWPAQAAAQAKPKRVGGKKKPVKSATKTPKPRTPKTPKAAPVRRGPSAVELEDARHNRQMGKLNRARLEATHANDTKAIGRVGRQVQLELKRHQQRRSAAVLKGSRATKR